MNRGATLAGHPVHPMLIVFPLGLLATALIFDIIHIYSGAATIAVASYWMIAAGIVGGLLAAVFGFWDWLAIPGHTRAKWIGAWHGVGNVVIVLCFAASWWLRRPAPADPSSLAILLALIGVLLAVLTGWLGGELVYQLGIGVDQDAHPDARSSLTHESTGSEGYLARGHALRT